MQKLNHYKNYLFDADGTMIDTDELESEPHFILKSMEQLV